MYSRELVPLASGVLVNRASLLNLDSNLVSIRVLDLNS